ncbi:MAG TPA: hypothetical protein VMS98_20210 [Thermoanaerobaculia bacterium]|nr:hypothetical protein [Thermoanaerobaculia bacterium]
MTATLFLSLLVAAPAFPQCSYQREHSGAYRASYLDLAVSGPELWAATGYGVRLFERTAERPAVIGTILLPGVTRFVRILDGLAYAASNSTIHVLRRNGSTLEVVRTHDAGATINDLEVTGSSIVAATTSGIISFDATGRSQLIPLGRNVFSIATIGDVIYAADGDTTIESYVADTALPALTSSVRATSVAAVNGRLLASDGRSTDVFLGATLARGGTIPYGITSVAAMSGDVVFVAGNDREVRALDLRVVETPVELFESELIPTGGSINRVSALAVAGDRLYVAGGDAGLGILDLAGFTAPFPLLAYRTGAATSVATDEETVFVAYAAGGISGLRRSSNGGLLLERSWAMESVHLLHQARDRFLLSSSGTALTYWALPSATAVSTATFRAPVRAAVRRGLAAYALLDDGTLWSADLAAQTPTPAQVTAAGGGRLRLLAGAGDSIASAEVADDGTTIIRFYGNGDPATAPATVSVAGAATTLAVDASRVALFTFAGIIVIDFSATPERVSVLEDSKTAIVTGLVIAGSDLVAVSSQTARIYDLASGRLERTFLLPAEASGVDATAQGNAAVATSEGVVALNPRASSLQPSAVATIAGNEYYRKAAAGRHRLYFFDGASIDVFDTYFAGTPQFLAAVTLPGVIDIAASGEHLYTLSNTGTVTQLSPGGQPIRSATVSQGPDVQPLSIATAAGAPWVSISTGCLTTGCEKRTLVLDPVTLTQTATLTGGVVDVTTSGTRTYAIFDLPDETRAYDTADPLHPSPIASRTSEPGSAAIASAAGTVLVLAGKLLVLDPLTLQTSVEASPATTIRGTPDILVDANCILVSLPSGPATLPGSLRSMAAAGGRLFLLTDYMLEILSRTAAPTPNRRRAAR